MWGECFVDIALSSSYVHFGARCLKCEPQCDDKSSHFPSHPLPQEQKRKAKRFQPKNSSLEVV